MASWSAPTTCHRSEKGGKRSTRRKARGGNSFRGSVAIAVVFAREKPWHGGPPIIPIRDFAFRASFTIADTPVGPNSTKSLATATDFGKFRLCVSMAALEMSKAALTLNPAAWKPWSRPPAPEKRLTIFGRLDDAFALRFVCGQRILAIKVSCRTRAHKYRPRIGATADGIASIPVHQ